MVTKAEQMEPMISPKDALVLLIVLVVVGLMAAVIASSPVRVQTGTYTQDAGNQPGVMNNSMNTGPVHREAK